MSSRRPRKVRSRLSLWFERALAAIALADLGLVIFDLTYISWRDFYVLSVPPAIHETYDRVKGIEPYRDTEQYIERVEDLKTQVALTGVESEEVEVILADLRERSIETIEDNPFQLAEKTGNLERIKNSVRDYIGNDSAKDSFRELWSQAHLRENWEASIELYEAELYPNFRTNYFRGISETGDFVDRFWFIDSFFIAFFGLEFLTRTWVMSRRLGTGWREAMLLRWFDVPLLLPFYRWLRVIPVAVRLDRAQILDLEPLRRRASEFVLAGVAAEMTETVVIQVLDQVQTAIRQDALLNALQSLEQPEDYIDLNNVDEVEELSQRLIGVSVYDVLPKIRPDLESLLHHTVFGAVEALPAYQSLKLVPGMEELPKRISHEVVGAIYDGIVGAIEDPVGAELTQNLTQNFAKALKTEVEKPKNLDEIESLLVALVDEIKINYVQRSGTRDIEAVVRETKRLQAAANQRS
ncbi:MAG: hypothetical protein ACFB9N_11960 [Geitlerinemataceae cyanobacterium]